jgi:hypothetical protein
MTRTNTGAAALTVLTLANLADVVGIGFVGTPGNPPALMVPSFVLAVIGMVATVPAWRGRRAGVLTVFLTRAVSTVLVVPFYLAGDQPNWVHTGQTIGIAVSLLGLGLLAAWWRQAAAREPARTG